MLRICSRDMSKGHARQFQFENSFKEIEELKRLLENKNEEIKKFKAKTYAGSLMLSQLIVYLIMFVSLIWSSVYTPHTERARVTIPSAWKRKYSLYISKISKNILPLKF